ncbi:MAG: prenyltransferase/squalene oxidase repeat-containing protein [Chloroflexota bacterium]
MKNQDTCLAPEVCRKHLDATMSWLARAQRPLGGFSAFYSLFKGWSLPYPETSGYIIETMSRYSSMDTPGEWQERIARAGAWLLNLQLPEGGFPAGYGTEGIPRVFNSGMILFGLAKISRSSNDSRFKDAGLRTLAWLDRIQNEDGSWTIASLEGQPHVYHSRVAWGMLEMAQTANVLDAYLPVIERANEWVVSQQNPDGWFEHNDLIQGLPPLTHNIAYTIRGLLECGHFLGRNKWLDSAVHAAHSVHADWVSSGYLASGYGRNWQRGPSFRCVTGEAQFGLIWYRLWQITGESHWLKAANGIAQQVAQTQTLHHFMPGVQGGIPGAWPIWERYLRFSYPNWAAKFFADLLMYILGR